MDKVRVVIGDEFYEVKVFFLGKENIPSSTVVGFVGNISLTKFFQIFRSFFRWKFRDFFFNKNCNSIHVVFSILVKAEIIFLKKNKD